MYKFLLIPDLHDIEYQNSSTIVSASWHGFVDLESYIDHYEWCVGQTSSPADDGILPCVDVGIQLSASKTLTVPLMDGKEKNFHLNFATCMSGLELSLSQILSQDQSCM